MPKKKIMTEMITMKVSPQEKEEWQRLAKGYRTTLAGLIRSRLSTIPKPLIPISRPRPAPKADPELIYQVAAIGNNLNQIARRVNSGEIKAVETLGQLRTIEQQLERLIGCTSNS
jgi:hypothetical protein